MTKELLYMIYINVLNYKIKVRTLLTNNPTSVTRFFLGVYFGGKVILLIFELLI